MKIAACYLSWPFSIEEWKDRWQANAFLEASTLAEKLGVDYTLWLSCKETAKEIEAAEPSFRGVGSDQPFDDIKAELAGSCDVLLIQDPIDEHSERRIAELKTLNPELQIYVRVTQDPRELFLQLSKERVAALAPCVKGFLVGCPMTYFMLRKYFTRAAFHYLAFGTRLIKALAPETLLQSRPINFATTCVEWKKGHNGLLLKQAFELLQARGYTTQIWYDTASQDMPSKYASAGLFVCPSLVGGPMRCLPEAAQQGCVVVVEHACDANTYVAKRLSLFTTRMTSALALADELEGLFKTLKEPSLPSTLAEFSHNVEVPKLFGILSGKIEPETAEHWKVQMTNPMMPAAMGQAPPSDMVNAMLSS